MNRNRTNIKKDEYIFRINRVIDYIDANIDQKITLALLSRIANFSEYHFHRIFKSIIGEPLIKYIQRIRIEKAAVQLIYNPQKSITEIAFDCGFSSSQFFSRVFKEYYEINASQWRNKNINKNKIIRTKSKIVKDIKFPFKYFNIRNNANIPESFINVKELPDMEAAYIRHIGAYKGNSDLFKSLYLKLFKWAEAHKLLNSDTRTIALYNDFPEITEEKRLRLTVCITVPKKTLADGAIGKLKIRGGKYAVARFEIFKNEFESAWDMVYGDWLPGSGYQPEDKPAFELFHNDPEHHPEKKYILDICVPVEPL